MLDKHAEEVIKVIEVLSKQLWGSNCEIGQVKVLNSPYAEFECPMRLYHKVNVHLTYDRSILGIAVQTLKGNVWVDDLTNEMIYDGFESSISKNILHNFQVLDEVVRNMTAKGDISNQGDGSSGLTTTLKGKRQFFM